MTQEDMKLANMRSSRFRKLVVRIVVLALACLMLFGTLYSVIVYTIMSASAKSYNAEYTLTTSEYNG